jgi:hypothetical protein
VVRFKLRPLYHFMYSCTSRLAIFQAPCNLRNLVSLFTCRASDSFRSQNTNCADRTYQRRASFILPWVAVTGTIFVTTASYRNILAVNPAPKPHAEKNYVTWRHIITLSFPSSKLTDFLEQSQDTLLLKGTKHQLSVYDKMLIINCHANYK